MKKVVFISSTYIDLKEERKEIWETLEKFDVIVKGMEDFGARSEDPLTTCMTEVEQSDIYVGVIGLRFGSLDKKSGKSFTQLEYERANELRKEILIYLIDEYNSKVTPNLIQFDKMEKLNSFKGLLKERHTIDTFSNAEDLKEKISRQLEKYLELKEPEKKDDDDYKNTEKILQDFFLVPKAISGREVKLKIKFIDKPRPISKSICELFNFEYGKSIVSKIEIIKPQFDFENFRHLFIGYDTFEEFYNLDKSQDYEIFATVLFKDEKAKKIWATFKDKKEVITPYDDYPDYEPPEPYTENTQLGEGQVVLRLKELIK